MPDTDRTDANNGATDTPSTPSTISGGAEATLAPALQQTQQPPCRPAMEAGFALWLGVMWLGAMRRFVHLRSRGRVGLLPPQPSL